MAPIDIMMVLSERTVTITDTTGRKLTLRQPALPEEFVWLEVLGPERAINQTLLNSLLPYCYLVGIQDVGEEPEELAFPTSYLQVLALQKRLGRPGYFAIRTAVEENWTAPLDPLALAKATLAERDRVKK